MRKKVTSASKELVESESFKQGLSSVKSSYKAVKGSETLHEGARLAKAKTKEIVKSAKEFAESDTVKNTTKAVSKVAQKGVARAGVEIKAVRRSVGASAWRGSAKDTLDMAAVKEEWKNFKVQGAEEFTIPARGEHTVCHVVQKGSRLRWTFRVKEHSVGFGVRTRHLNSKSQREEEVLAVQRYDSGDTISGSWVADEDWSVLLVFDNKQSMLKSKTVACMVGVQPTTAQAAVSGGSGVAEEEVTAVLDSLAGQWFVQGGTEADRGNISGNVVTFPDGSQARMAVEGKDRITVVLGDEPFYGQIAENEIHWSDGDVWVREDQGSASAGAMDDHTSPAASSPAAVAPPSPEAQGAAALAVANGGSCDLLGGDDPAVSDNLTDVASAVPPAAAASSEGCDLLGEASTPVAVCTGGDLLGEAAETTTIVPPAPQASTTAPAEPGAAVDDLLGEAFATAPAVSTSDPPPQPATAAGPQEPAKAAEAPPPPTISADLEDEFEMMLGGDDSPLKPAAPTAGEAPAEAKPAVDAQFDGMPDSINDEADDNEDDGPKAVAPQPPPAAFDPPPREAQPQEAPPSAAPADATQPSASSDPELSEGCFVEIHSLTGAQEFNGCRGTLRHLDPTTQRWQVDVPDKGIKNLKAANLTPVAAAEDEAR